MKVRALVKALKIARNTVRDIVRGGDAQPSASPTLPAVIQTDRPLEITLRLLFKRCEGSAIRVRECLHKEYGVRMAYSTLTRCIRSLRLRRRRRGQEAHVVIVTGPGVEMQHDTSPMRVRLGRVMVKLHLASLVCGFSRYRYYEFFARWQRFHVKVFLVRGVRFLGGVAEWVQVDNARLIIILGAGPDGEISPEMERFAGRLGFKFVAVYAGDKDRQGKVERAHQFVQQNFMKGRRFKDLADLNQQLLTWCRELFHKRVRHQTFAPADRWDEELAHMRTLPVFIPEPSRIWSRKVDDYGRVWLNGSSYKVPDSLVFKWMSVQETGDEVIVMDGRNEVCRHRRTPECERGHSPLPGERRAKSRRAPTKKPSEEEVHLRSIDPAVGQYLDALRSRPVRYSYARLRRLCRFASQYPREIFVSTIAAALARRAVDLNQLEGVLEQKMGHRIHAASADDGRLEERPAYRKGQVTPHRLQNEPWAGDNGANLCVGDQNEPEPEDQGGPS
ncbi:MAG: transposase [Candidatus Wallbacteria bacterium]|nr:transposase [Candidatus Wallbacteria bacterium]